MPPEPQKPKDNIHNQPAAPRTSCKSMDENTAFDLGPFVLEWFAGNRPANQLPISAVCNCHCLFCSNHLNPFPVIGGVFRNLEDIKLQLCYMAANDDPIRAGLSALEKWPDADLFLVPSNPFDALLRDLVGTPAYRISERLGRPVWLVQSDGIIDSLLSMRLLKRRKPLDSSLKQDMALTHTPITADDIHRDIIHLHRRVDATARGGEKWLRLFLNASLLQMRRAIQLALFYRWKNLHW